MLALLKVSGCSYCAQWSQPPISGQPDIGRRLGNGIGIGEKHVGCIDRGKHLDRQGQRRPLRCGQSLPAEAEGQQARHGGGHRWLAVVSRRMATRSSAGLVVRAHEALHRRPHRLPGRSAGRSSASFANTLRKPVFFIGVDDDARRRHHHKAAHALRMRQGQRRADQDPSDTPTTAACSTPNASRTPQACSA